MSRAVGLHFLPDGTDVSINQSQHAQPNGEYKIQDIEKRAEFERQKAKKLKGINQKKGE